MNNQPGRALSSKQPLGEGDKGQHLRKQATAEQEQPYCLEVHSWLGEVPAWLGWRLGCSDKASWQLHSLLGP